MKEKSVSYPNQSLSIFLFGVVFLFFFQLLTEFVEGIYLYGLLGSDIPPEIGLVVLLFVPLVLVFSRKNLSGIMIKILLSLGLVGRAVEIVLATRGRMIVSGLGAAGLLLAFPAVLALPRSRQEQQSFLRSFGLGFSTALLLHMLFRALLSGSDLSGYSFFRIISWGLALGALFVLWRSFNFGGGEKQSDVETSKSNVLLSVLGIFGVLTTIYFSIEAPNVLARWAGISPFVVFVLLVVSWGVAGWWWLNTKQVSKTMLLIGGLLFVLATLFAILPHQVDFPASVDGGYPLLEPEISFIQILPLYFMLVLSPVLFLLILHYLNLILANQPKLRLLGGSFGLGGFFLLVMILSHVFTTVYDYIPVIGPFFRDKFWLVYLVAGLVAVLPVLLKGKAEAELSEVDRPIKQTWLGSVGLILVVLVVGMILVTASPPAANDQPDSLRIFTYNIQQGYNDLGERNFDGQVALIASTDPDIVGLQESDTARIAGGNADVVAYFANRLDMYSYYGPSPITGTFGIALLSKYPIQNPHTYFLYSEGEQVAVIEAELVIGGTTYKIYVTHLGNGGPIFQMRQMLDLMRGQENVIAMGDFNYRPYEEQYAITTAEWDDAYMHAADSTFPGPSAEKPFDIGERIDHVFVSPGTPVLYVEYFPQIESDHPGLFVELGLGN